MKESDSLDEQFRRMIVITDQLAAIKAPVPEDEFIVALLLSRPRSYNTLVTALSQLHQALLNEDENESESIMDSGHLNT